jgi:hypothetical protein
VSACESCLHDFECFEKRGRCSEYKNLEEVKQDIEMLNQKAVRGGFTGCSAADKGVQKFGVSGVPRRDGDPENKAQ